MNRDHPWRGTRAMLALLSVALLISPLFPIPAQAAPALTGYLYPQLAYTDTERITLVSIDLDGSAPPTPTWYGPDGSPVSPACAPDQVLRALIYEGEVLVQVQDYFYISSCSRALGEYRVTIGAEIDLIFTLKKRIYRLSLPLILVPPLTPQPPGTFAKLSPEDGASGLPINVTLDWEDAREADTYAYCIDTSNDNTCADWVDTGTASQAEISGLLPGTAYYWQARAANSQGITYADFVSLAYWVFTTGSGSSTTRSARLMEP